MFVFACLFYFIQFVAYVDHDCGGRITHIQYHPFGSILSGGA
jgi:hypothetical protein